MFLNRPDARTCAAALDELRIGRGMTAEDAADALGFDRSQLADLIAENRADDVRDAAAELWIDDDPEVLG